MLPGWRHTEHLPAEVWGGLLELRVWGSGIRVWGLGFRVWGSGLREVDGLWCLG